MLLLPIDLLDEKIFFYEEEEEAEKVLEWLDMYSIKVTLYFIFALGHYSSRCLNKVRRLYLPLLSFFKHAYYTTKGDLICCYWIL